ncbi:hypothetical protein V8C86DRAFT_1837275 [Haematococcus lacustris]
MQRKPVPGHPLPGKARQLHPSNHANCRHISGFLPHCSHLASRTVQPGPGPLQSRVAHSAAWGSRSSNSGQTRALPRHLLLASPRLLWRQPVSTAVSRHCCLAPLPCPHTCWTQARVEGGSLDRPQRLQEQGHGLHLAHLTSTTRRMACWVMGRHPPPSTPLTLRHFTLSLGRGWRARPACHCHMRHVSSSCPPISTCSPSLLTRPSPHTCSLGKAAQSRAVGRMLSLHTCCPHILLSQDRPRPEPSQAVPMHQPAQPPPLAADRPASEPEPQPYRSSGGRHSMAAGHQGWRANTKATVTVWPGVGRAQQEDRA